MKKKYPLGNLYQLKITMFSPFSSTVPEYSTVKTSADNTMLKQWLKGKVGVSFPSTIVHFSGCLVQLDKITRDNFSGLALVGGAV